MSWDYYGLELAKNITGSDKPGLERVMMIDPRLERVVMSRDENDFLQEQNGLKHSD